MPKTDPTTPIGAEIRKLMKMRSGLAKHYREVRREFFSAETALDRIDEKIAKLREQYEKHSFRVAPPGGSHSLPEVTSNEIFD